jgi:hypothetical protein
MGTKALEPETGEGVIKRVGARVSILREDTSEVAYGRKGGSLYPLVLIALTGSSTLLHAEVVSLVSLVLLAVWVGGRR